jgi:hypothetical protein
MHCLILIAHLRPESLCQILAQTAVATTNAGHGMRVTDLSLEFFPTLTKEEPQSYYEQTFNTAWRGCRSLKRNRFCRRPLDDFEAGSARNSTVGPKPLCGASDEPEQHLYSERYALPPLPTTHSSPKEN